MNVSFSCKEHQKLIPLYLSDIWPKELWNSLKWRSSFIQVLLYDGPHYTTCLYNHFFRLLTRTQTDALKTIPAYAIATGDDYNTTS